MELSYAYLRLDKDWDMQKLAELSRLYTQCYSLVYSLSAPKIDVPDSYLPKSGRFASTYYRYRWRKGYSAVNFYNALYRNIPYEHRPLIKEIRYESPGHIKLMDAARVASLLSMIIISTTLSFDRVHHTYINIQNRMKELMLTDLEIELMEIERKRAGLELIREGTRLSEEMGINYDMQEELQRLTGDNGLKGLSILMSFKRRVEPIVQMQKSKELTVEIPNNTQD